jgi:hypothetical protein
LSCKEVWEISKCFFIFLNTVILVAETHVTIQKRWKAISEILQRSDNDVKNRWNSKGYSRCLKEFSDNSLNETRAMLIETPKAMTDGEPSTLAKSLTSGKSIPPDTCETLQISENNFKPNILRTSRSLKRIAPFEGSRSLTSEKYPKVPVEIQPAIAPGVELVECHHSKTILPFQEHSDESNASSNFPNTSPMEISQAEVGIGLRSFCSPDLHYTSSPFQSDELSSFFASYGRNPATDVTQELSPATMSSEKASDTPLPYNSEPHFSANSYDFLGRKFFSPGIRTPASDNDMISPIGHLYSL